MPRKKERKKKKKREPFVDSVVRGYDEMGGKTDRKPFPTPAATTLYSVFAIQLIKKDLDNQQQLFLVGGMLGGYNCDKKMFLFGERNEAR